MSNQAPFTSVPVVPDLSTLLDKFKRALFLDLSCHHVGTVESFDKDKQTAQVSVNYKQTFTQIDPKTNTYKPVLVDYPVLLDCPVICLGGGPASLTFPISKGDECMVLFNDRDIDTWFSGQKAQAPGSNRAHNFSDAIVIVGLRSLSNVLTDYDMTHAGFKYGNTEMKVGDKVRLANAVYTLNGLLQELLGEIRDLVSATSSITVSGVTSGGGVSGPPVNAGTIAAISSQITATGNKIEGLFE